MKKADKLKKDLEAFNVLSSQVPDLKMKFLVKDNVLHTQYAKACTASGYKTCRLAGDSSLTLTKPLHILNNLDKICVGCLNSLSFNKSSKSLLSSLLKDFSSLLKVNKSLSDASEQIKDDGTYFSYFMNLVEADLRKVYTSAVKKLVPAYSSSYDDAEINTSLKMSYHVKLFVSLYEKLVKQKNDLLKERELYLLSDEHEKVFLTEMARSVLPIPSLAVKQSKILKFREETLQLQKDLVQDSGWALFSICPIPYPTSLARTILSHLVKYETNQKNLFHAPQLYLDYWLSLFSDERILSSARFTNPVDSLILENVAGIYSPDSAGANSSLRNVLAAAKII